MGIRTSPSSLQKLANPAFANHSTDDDRWYVTIIGGWSGVRDASATLEPLNSTSTSGELKIGSGFLYGGSIGYQIDPSWRIEGELTYRGNGVDAATIAGVDSERNDGDLASLALMVNGLYLFEGWESSFTRFRPFVGAGSGGPKRLIPI